MRVGKEINPKRNRKFSAQNVMFSPPCSWGLSICLACHAASQARQRRFLGFLDTEAKEEGNEAYPSCEDASISLA